jgi:LmbE family N-acetylglucosaminyl deacetylase
MTRSSVQRFVRLGVLSVAANVAMAQHGAGPRRAPNPAARANVLDVFMVAHPDDWQLFMGDAAVAAARRGTPTLFVIVTAGDAGRPAKYWLARERGAIASMLVANDAMPADSAQLGGETVQPAECRTDTMDSQRVRHCSIRSSASLFLRLPDGNIDALGFASTGRTSLQQLEQARVPMLVAVDSGMRAASWATLGATVGDLITREAARARVSAGRVRLHAQDPDSLLNPKDHSDHRAVGRLAGAIAQSHTWALTYYADYSVTDRPVNRSAAQFSDKLRVFLAYDRARILADTTWSAYAESPRLYSSWLSRTYAREIRALSPILLTVPRRRP